MIDVEFERGGDDNESFEGETMKLLFNYEGTATDAYMKSLQETSQSIQF